MTDRIVNAFKGFLPCAWAPNAEQIETLVKLVRFANTNNYEINADFEVSYMEAVNQKLNLNKEVYKKILDQAFVDGIRLNHIQKGKIRNLLDRRDTQAYKAFLISENIFTDGMVSKFVPIPKSITENAIKNTSLVDSKYKDVYCSIFSRFCFNLFPLQCCFNFFSGCNTIDEDYYTFIGERYDDIMDRSHALYIIDVDQSIFSSDYVAGCNKLLNSIKNAYRMINNHCYLAVYIPQIFCCGKDIQWKLFSNVILYAEKHNKEKIDKEYFRWEKIGKTTVDYINNISAFDAEFEYAFQGFIFKDCFVLGSRAKKYAILLVFEKNIRDERVFNCPACRSAHVQGNSYPILNVKSWECQNPLCPERSKYNRGKRYSIMSLLRQREMMNDDNIVPSESVDKWHLDCRQIATKQEAFEMLLRHYSCVKDGIYYISLEKWNQDSCNRNITHETFIDSKYDILTNFKNYSYFYRYIHYNDRQSTSSKAYINKKAKIFYGDSLDVLRAFSEHSISAAVTSPPYYNAKSYSSWPNIYCYLYDMYNINNEVFRVLQPGGVLLYNIFDYYDNENNIALSAMGNKRMILGAYMIDIFERIGFKICGNIIWNKGEVQGNRSFNQGNFAPYYQAPLNCWEHILIVSKGRPNKKFSKLFSAIVDIKPVIKIVRGKNILGHSAPFPYEIPGLIIDCLNENDTVLDPFLGSGTTCIVANRNNVFSVGIEKDKNYYNLCRKLIYEDSYKNELLM